MRQGEQVIKGEFGPQSTRGAFSGDPQAIPGSGALDFLSHGGRARNSPNGFVATFTIFNLMLQVIGHFNGDPAAASGDRSQYESALFPIWPAPTGDLVWPPAVAFSRTSWEDLIASISDRTTA